MSLRIAIVCLSSLLGACSAGGDTAISPEADSGALCAQSLQFAGPAVSSILQNASTSLEVHFQDLLGGSAANVRVDFVLTGVAAQGASLTPAQAVTDENGVARTQLRVGSTTGDLQVRARTPCGLSAYTQVSVGQALGARLAVTVRYDGLRQISSYTVTSLPGMSCAAALKSGMAGDVSYTIAATSSTPIKFELGSNTSAAILGFGRDASGAKLALGCQEYTAPITADSLAAQNALVLTLDNQALRLDNELQVDLKVDLMAAAQRLSDTAVSAVDTALAASARDPAAAQGDYYLDAVVAALTKLNDSSALAALAGARSSGVLASSLTAALEQGLVGPKAIGTQLGALLLDRGAELTLSSSYKAGVLGPISAVGALSSDGTQSLALSAQPTASISASFASDSAQLSIRSLHVALALGDYGVGVLQAIQAEGASKVPQPNKPSSIEAAAGCSSVLGPWWSQSSVASVCDVSVAVAACETATGTLLGQVQSKLQTLNSVSPALQLSGSVQTEDRSDDGQIDDLGPTDVAGSWGADTVVADLTVPVRTAFAR